MIAEPANNFDDLDVVKFELNKPSLVRIETSETDDPSFVDTIIGLTNSAGQALAANDDAGPGIFGSRLELCFDPLDTRLTDDGFILCKNQVLTDNKDQCQH